MQTCRYFLIKHFSIYTARILEIIDVTKARKSILWFEVYIVQVWDLCIKRC